MRCVLNEGMPHKKNPMERGKLVIHFDVDFPNSNWIRDPKKLHDLESILPPRPAGGPTMPYTDVAAPSPAASPTADGGRKTSAKKGSVRRSAGGGEDTQGSKPNAPNPKSSSSSTGGAASGNPEDPNYWNSAPSASDHVIPTRMSDFDAEAYVRQRQEEAARQRGFGSRFVFAGGPGAHGGDEDESEFGGGGGGQRVQCASS